MNLSVQPSPSVPRTLHNKENPRLLLAPKSPGDGIGRAWEKSRNAEWRVLADSLDST